ncbi:aminodeoxychorismate synthase component I, partial [Candidatus Pelagibacter sp.]|nr:aminodeoxychorismate synthase component I [Candidatus Pelagibacter sp.]
MNKKKYLQDLNNSKKPFIIYKSDKGFDLYTDFSKKIILNNKNIEKFINKNTKFKSIHKETDLFIGFFGYEILNNLIDVKIKKQKTIN